LENFEMSAAAANANKPKLKLNFPKIPEPVAVSKASESVADVAPKSPKPGTFEDAQRRNDEINRDMAKGTLRRVESPKADARKIWDGIDKDHFFTKGRARANAVAAAASLPMPDNDLLRRAMRHGNWVRIVFTTGRAIEAKITNYGVFCFSIEGDRVIFKSGLAALELIPLDGEVQQDAAE
jgi:hypothetical protein